MSKQVNFVETQIGQPCSKLDMVVNYVLNSSYCDVVVYFRDADDNIIKTQVVKIEGQEYQDWSDSDDYLIDLVISKLGLTKV